MVERQDASASQVHSGSTHELAYRPDIDGLRAVAILLVVLFHAGLGTSGGFVGVDVFFVISGFLITSIVMGKLEKGRFSLVQFWERRIRRLLPAFFVVCVFTFGLGWLCLLPVDFEELGSSLVAGSMGLANFYFWKTSGYFAAESEDKFLLHYWSLAVEEQFYVFLPLALLIFVKFLGRRSLQSVQVMLGLGLVVSFALNVLLVHSKPTVAFYLLPCRAWEMFLGALVATSPKPTVRWAQGPFSRLLGWFSLGVVVGVAIRLDVKTPFPGWAALLPCLAAAMLLWLGSANGFAPGRMDIQKWLSLSPFVWVGKISYSLYLWHWPLMAVLNYFDLFRDLSFKIAAVAASVLLGALSWKFVESPFRRPGNIVHSKRLFLVATTASILIATMGSAAVLTRGFPQRFDAQVHEVDRVVRELRGTGFVSADEIRAVSSATPSATAVLSSSKPRKILVWGDSHVGNVLPAMADIAGRNGTKLYTTWYPRTPPVLGYHRLVPDSLGARTTAWAEKTVAQTIREGFTDVVMAARWSAHFRHETEFGGVGENFGEALKTTIGALKGAGIRVWLIKEIPAHPGSPSKVAYKRRRFDRETPDAYCTLARHESDGKKLAAVEPDLARLGVRTIDPAYRFVDAGGRRYCMEMDGEMMYLDEHHLTRAGAMKMVADLKPIFTD